MSFPRNAKASDDEVARARELRAQGSKLEQIAAELGRSTDWAWKATKDIRPPAVRVITKTAYKNFPGFPDDPALAQRIRNLARRGFDVPPSKQADWETLARAGMSVKERRKVLGLE